MRNRLVLGTVQLGMPYGIANVTGQPDLAMAEQIIASAFDAGIEEFDTAQAYGTSETVLGSVFKTLGVTSRVKVISKLNPDACLDREKHILLLLKEYIEKSLIRLGVNRLYGLMLHREDLLDQWNQELGEVLMELVRQGWIDHIGVSVYTPDRAMLALDLPGMDMVQLPSNILDRRFENAGIFDKAASLGKMVFVRSVFLQGLFFKPASELKQIMPWVCSVVERIDDLAQTWCISSHEMCLGFAKTAYPQARILFGAETPEQVKMNVTKWNQSFPEDRVDKIRKTFNDISEDILNPSCWPQ